jgi:hypothetical protein
MTAASVQTNDSPAYLPPSPSTSTPDAKGTGAAGKPASDAPATSAQGAPSDFQSELELQSGTQQTGPQKIESKTSPKADTGKPGKRRSVRPEDVNLAAVTPVQITEPQKPILPVALALAPPQELAQQQENDKLADDGKTAVKATAKETPQEPVQQFQELKQPVGLKQSMKVRQSAQPEATPNQTAASTPTPPAAADPGKIPVPAVAPVLFVTQDPSARQEGKKSEDPLPQDEAITITKPGVSSNSQPVSPADLRLPATPAEPIATAVQETLDRAPSSPSALAFAARMSASPQKPDQPVAVNSSQNPVQSPAISGSQTAVRIPVRYAATAQIIQSAALGTQQDGPKKDTDASGFGPARPSARTDMVLPQFETVSPAAASSGSAAPPQTAPAARAESVIEPPAAPPTSPHDIRVRVPDNNGGSTQVRFVETGGEVRVSVRTADEGLAQNLRTHLNDLTQRLSDGGMPAEIWKPAFSAGSSQNDFQQPSQQDGRGSGGQGSGGQNGQQDRQQKRPAWLDEMEASLHGEQG